MFHTQQQPTGAPRWLRSTVTALSLGVGALVFSAGSAFATPVPGEIWEMANLTIEKVVEQSNNPLQAAKTGVDERTILNADLSHVDWSMYSIVGATLHLNITPYDAGIFSDAITIGSMLDGDMDIADPVYLHGVDLFVDCNQALCFDVPTPTVVDGSTPVDVWVDLFDHYNGNQLRTRLLNGDLGQLLIKYADDAVVNGGYIELHAEPVPEPASLLLLGSGLVGMAAWRYRKSSKA